MKEQLIQKPSPLPSLTSADLDDYEYQQFGKEPHLQVSKLVLAIAVPFLLGLNMLISRFFDIPVLQYAFMSSLVAFLVNYTSIIRRYELMPFLKEDYFDARLKYLNVSAVAAMVISMYYGWNGSGGMLFAIFWQTTRGQKMGIYWLYFLVIIVGSLLMEENYSQSKLIQFIPGILMGWSNAQLYKLKESNEYTVAHQFLFLSSMVLPVLFPTAQLVVPTLLQWGVMILGGFLMLFSVVCVIKLMQEVRVSVTAGLLAGILMIMTTKYNVGREYIGAGLILVGGILLLRVEFQDKI